ncbi:MAG: xanthine dehydrogenase family protein molybdopterin-binding subunit [Geminicoccaceae bacterium]|nr:MAG: xanthine dehydrogenase family protein molybdopterin-binding subunit [Geminicoccaceae bacterium]
MPARSTELPLQEIGRSRPRGRTRALLAGHGRYLDDLDLPRQVHGAFLRSPVPAARIDRLDVTAARTAPGVVAVFTWDDLRAVCRPWRTVSAAFPGLQSPEQTPLAAGRVTAVGEPIALVVAASRALAEDAIELIDFAWTEQPAVGVASEALAPGAPLVHPELGSNLAWQFDAAAGDVDAAFAAAALVVEERFVFGRHTGVPLETRGILAAFDRSEARLTVWASHQMPHQLQLHLADLLDLPMSRVEVTAMDVGGGFGIKMHVYPDEIAICAAARLLARPVKFVADRLESLTSDVHAREHVIDAKLAVDGDGRLLAIDAKGLQGIGSHSVFPRSSTVETLMAMRTLGAPYALAAARAHADVVFQNKAMTGQYRSVGHPIACAVTEALVERAAALRGEDSLALRRRNYLEPGDDGCRTALGLELFDFSHAACLERLEAMLDVAGLRAQIAAARQRGEIQGLGFAAFVEMTASGSEIYGKAGVPVSAADTVQVAIEPDGSIKASASLSEIGQGITEGLIQVLADAVGVAPERIALEMGRTASGPHGGGAWASRGAAIGGEAAWQAGRALRGQVLEAAGALLQMPADTLDLVAGWVVDASGERRIEVAELARMVHFRGHEFPAGTAPQFQVAHHHRRAGDPTIPTNGIQAAWVSICRDTGLVRCLKHWVVHDCGRMLNPLLVTEQVRGGVVQGLGAALFEHCRYDAQANFLDGSLADYLVPMATEMPDIEVGHVETAYRGSVLGAKGAGEAGTCAASAAVLNAVNDALRAAGGTSIATLPLTPPLVLAALEGGSSG